MQRVQPAPPTLVVDPARVRALARIQLDLVPAEPAAAQEPKAEFSRTTIDLGVVVSDLEESAKFYTEAIGFTEAPGFAVPADFCTKAGLTDGHPLRIEPRCVNGVVNEITG